MGAVPAKETLDARGKKITTYILYAAVMKLGDMKEGEVLEIVTDSFEPIEGDIRAWCRMTGHALTELEEGAAEQRYYIRKAAQRPTDKHLALVISDPGLEELLSPLGFALAAALGGTAVAIYFQGPAVRVLKRGFNGSLKGVSRVFSTFARKGMAKMGHVPPQDKLRQLEELGAKFYICGPSMEHFGVAKGELAFDGAIVAEYLTFMEVMTRADIHIYV